MPNTPSSMPEVDTQQHADILALWRDPKVGLTGLARFHRKLSDRGIFLSSEALHRVLLAQPEFELFAGQATHEGKHGNTITETHVGVSWQIDLLDMSAVASANHGVSWILCAIDVFSRYAWALPLKRKTQGLVSAALLTILNEAHHQPARMTSDNGREWLNDKVQALFRSRDIEHYTVQVGDKRTVGIVERFNRTLRGYLGRNFQRLGRLTWVKDLPQLVYNYNTTLHRTLGVTPQQVWSGEAMPVARRIYREKFAFMPGQKVRVRIKRDIFEKRVGAQTWCTDVYTVKYRTGFKYVLTNAAGVELKTRYRPTELRLATSAAGKFDPSQKGVATRKTVEQKKEAARKTKRIKAFKKRQNIDDKRIRRTKLRPRKRRKR